MQHLAIAYLVAGALTALWLDEPHSGYDSTTEHAAVLVLIAATWPVPLARIAWRTWQSIQADDDV